MYEFNQQTGHKMFFINSVCDLLALKTLQVQVAHKYKADMLFEHSDQKYIQDFRREGFIQKEEEYLFLGWIKRNLCTTTGILDSVSKIL